MAFSTFNTNQNDQLKEPMFFGQGVNVSRYDQQKYSLFEKLIEKQLSFFWRPEEIDVSKDAIDFRERLNEAERHIFLSNLKYQTLLDSVQGRSPNIAFLPIVSLPELETWIETWSFSETIHSRSYTHIIRNLVPDPSIVFNDIVTNKAIQKRALAVTEHYDNLIQLVGRTVAGLPVDEKEIKTALFLTMVSVNVLEAIRFYVSFACSFSFAERKLMEGNAKIIRLIARDEALHLSGTQNIIKMWLDGVDDESMQQVANENIDKVYEIFRLAAEQEMEWADYLFKNGSMIGLSSGILKEYIEYITNIRIKAIGLNPIYQERTNPLPWMNNWLVSDNVQVAPQESEISSYLVGQVDSKVSADDFGGFSL
jgi:ribonucleoside-diphosphate reductase beta chain